MSFLDINPLTAAALALGTVLSVSLYQNGQVEIERAKRSNPTVITEITNGRTNQYVEANGVRFYSMINNKPVNPSNRGNNREN